MESGKIQYAPDYRSNRFSDYFAKAMENPEFKEAYLKVSAEEDAKLKVAFEREWKVRDLERAVVEAAKRYRREPFDDASMINLDEATDALTKFEAENKVE